MHFRLFLSIGRLRRGILLILSLGLICILRLTGRLGGRLGALWCFSFLSLLLCLAASLIFFLGLSLSADGFVILSGRMTRGGCVFAGLRLSSLVCGFHLRLSLFNHFRELLFIVAHLEPPAQQNLIDLVFFESLEAELLAFLGVGVEVLREQNIGRAA